MAKQDEKELAKLIFRGCYVVPEPTVDELIAASQTGY